MRRRSAFTLVEMMVSVALVLFIMVILTEAFGKGLESFRTLKGIGDLESKLRAATTVLRRDLAFDHFEGKRRLSDDWQTWNLAGPPREGWFEVRVIQGPGAITPEGSDADSISYRRASNWLLHFTAKARGNDRSEFFTASKVPKRPLLLGGIQGPIRSTFFDQPTDARFQDTQDTYSSQWAEVVYFLQPNGRVVDGVPLHTLFRAQLVMVADNSKLNWPAQVPQAQASGYSEMSWYIEAPPGGGQPYLHFCTPSELAQGRNRYDPTTLRGATPILTEVVSFDLSWLRNVEDFSGTRQALEEESEVGFSSAFRHVPDERGLYSSYHALKITLRAYDPQTKLTRQMTMIQDL